MSDHDSSEAVKKMNEFSAGQRAARHERHKTALERLAGVLARFTTDDMARRSIELTMGQPHAKEWAEIRDAAGLRGWNTLEEAEAHFRRLFGL